ncbi:hypothetical protein IQ235_03890 [Oscillatoriales cyanobacterium LEGE 11467]|uniref:Uncharacterized protein n=1 Tax=Zarconia navalis LEGE 11467 TaxID=1828826 RepID=A0A928VV99_9CYAN|nr:hypothetical protein [Zarconia navalis]MBE9039933.1 hypothetical protein [Zarconia navalis LEGE 11467]
MVRNDGCDSLDLNVMEGLSIDSTQAVKSAIASRPLATSSNNMTVVLTRSSFFQVVNDPGE